MAFTTNVNQNSVSFINSATLTKMSTGKRRYNIKLWKTFTDCFNCLPIAAIIDEKIFTMHGGLSPDLQSMEQIRRVMRPTDVPDTGLCLNTNLPLSCLLTPTHVFRSAVRSSVVGPRQGYHRVVRKRPGSFLYVWSRRRLAVPAKT